MQILLKCHFSPLRWEPCSSTSTVHLLLLYLLIRNRLVEERSVQHFSNSFSLLFLSFSPGLIYSQGKGKETASAIPVYNEIQTSSQASLWNQPWLTGCFLSFHESDRTPEDDKCIRQKILLELMSQWIILVLPGLSGSWLWQNHWPLLGALERVQDYLCTGEHSRFLLK